MDGSDGTLLGPWADRDYKGRLKYCLSTVWNMRRSAKGMWTWPCLSRYSRRDLAMMLSVDATGRDRLFVGSVPTLFSHRSLGGSGLPRRTPCRLELTCSGKGSCHLERCTLSKVSGLVLLRCSNIHASASPRNRKVSGTRRTPGNRRTPGYARPAKSFFSNVVSPVGSRTGEGRAAAAECSLQTCQPPEGAVNVISQ